MTPFLRTRWVTGFGILALVTVGLVPVSVAVGQVNFPGAPDTFGTNVRVYPADFYSPRVGPGIGLGLVAHNVAQANDQWLLTAAPAFREQVATLSFASANPRRARQYVLADVRGLHTDRDWISGRNQNRVTIERSSLHGRVRVGQMILDDRILVQPHAVFSTHFIDAVHSSPDGTTAPTLPLPSPENRQIGLRPGVDLEFDTRDHSLQSTRGVLLQATGRQYISLDETSIQFSEFHVEAYTYLPLGGLHRLALRVSSLLTQSYGEDPIPGYLRPRLGATLLPGLARSQFRGLDRLIGSTLYRFPVTNFYGLAALEGHVGIHLAGIYDNISTEFGSTISFTPDDGPENGVQPFRPAASAGIRFLVPARDRASLELAVGISPYGISGIRFTFTRSLRGLRPPHHMLDHLW